MANTVLAYRYRRPTEMLTGGVGGFVMQTCDGTMVDGDADPISSAQPQLFSGFVDHPRVVAAGLLAVAKVAATRYYTPGAMTAAKIRAADPVVTADGERLRFESLSPCSGVYARLDVLADGLDADVHAVGTTNIDLNPPARAALAEIVGGEPLHLDVGEDEVRIRTLDANVVERRVPLPDRWIRSFSEVHVLARDLVPRFELSAPRARKLLAGLPSASTRSTVWLAGSGAGPVQVPRWLDGSLTVPGPERLATLQPVLRFATAVRALGSSAQGGVSAWIVELPGARLTLVLSADASRGFSGEGSLLHSLADDAADEDIDLVESALADGANRSSGELATSTGLTGERVDRALSLLGRGGNVGLDIADGRIFLRALPFRPRLLGRSQPRLATAERLIEAGAVSGGPTRFEVLSRDATHVLSVDGDDWSCTCTWWARHQGDRGPCAHELAARLWVGRPDE